MTVDKKDTSVGVVNENETVVSENSDEIITEALEEENKKRKNTI